MAEVTLGGDRLGSGNQMKQELHNYGMNSFNLSRDWKSSAAPGVLIPCFKEIGTNFGTFDIDIDTFVRTLPTKGPLFGSFKMQVDLFNVPFRLYQGVLHNNPVDIGLNMSQVLLPKVALRSIIGPNTPKVKGSNFYSHQINESSLEKYMGMSGIAMPAGELEEAVEMYREVQCVPELGYYDIFKNYYSNKQEEKAYVITPGTPKEASAIAKIIIPKGYQEDYQEYDPYTGQEFTLQIANLPNERTIDIYYEYIEGKTKEDYLGGTKLLVGDTDIALDDLETAGEIRILSWELLPNNLYSCAVYIEDWEAFIQDYDLQQGTEIITNATLSSEINSGLYTSDIQLTPFALKNIDKMRAKLLSCNELNTQFKIERHNDEQYIWGVNSGVDMSGLPYKALVQTTHEGIPWNAFTQNGLVVKTYQSDLFNNWLDNTFVDTIASRTKIDTTSGGFTPDTLILQEKIYKLLNRILVGGGTYYDWQEATYGEGVARMCEIPLYIGGMSTEIMFEEVISNAETKVNNDYQPLGSLGGKGTSVGKKGGNNIHVRMDEPGYILGILSITPRVSYSQGNDWDRTELNSIDDLHKPELDGIGFQDLMAEQMCWWDTKYNDNEGKFYRNAVGKQTAWINYQTAVDKVYGDFAKQDGYSFMVLNRNYEVDEETNGIKDMTTYIDPSKYNYAFAVQELAAQNFWVQLAFKVTGRRKMGAQQLPNL